MKLTAIVRAARWLTGRWIPAAADNTRGRDAESLITCRRIGRLPVADPDTAQDANNYLRRKEGDQP